MGSGRPEGRASIDISEDGAVVHLIGEWDLTSADQLRELLDRVDASGLVAFNLSKLEFADSSILRVLAIFKKHSLALGGRTSISFGNRGIKRIFDICGLTDALQH